MTSQLSDFDFDESVSDLIERFEAALAKIQKALQAFLLTDAQRKDMLKAEKEIIDILSDIETYIDKWAETSVTEVSEEAKVAVLTTFGLRTIAKKLDWTRNQMAMRTFIIESIQTDMRQVTTSLSRQSRTVLRRTYSETLRQTTRQASRQARQLINEADVAIVDKAGRRWKTSTYVDMLARTKLMEAYRETAVLEGIASGNGHAYISYNPKTTDRCRDFQYKIVKLATDIESPYPYYKDLPHLGHPCCRHHFLPLKNFDDLPDEVRRANGL